MASVESTQKITSAMKMVSAAKLRRAQNTILKMRPYAKELSSILSHLLSTASEGETNPLEIQRVPEKVIMVIITSNKGLCGGFNNNVLKRMESLLSGEYATQMAQHQVQFIGIGKKAIEYLNRKKYPVVKSYESILDHCTFAEAGEIAEGLMNQFSHKEIDKVVMVYNKFKNAATQELMNETYLPIHFEETPAASTKKNGSGDKTEKESHTALNDFIFEPSRNELYQQLVPSMTKMKFYQCLLESIAAEHGARMTAMHKATENASELTKQLNLTYNKLRQAAITNELIEMVSGAESLKNA